MAGWLVFLCGRNLPLSPKSGANGCRQNCDLNSESLSPTKRKINARQATTIIAMPKRKRNESIPRSKDAPPATRAERMLEDGQRNVAGALKLCQRFERQKLGRRVKDATAAADSDSAKTLDRLNREIQALKVWRKSWTLVPSSLVQTLDFDVVARHHIQRLLLRIKTIASSNVLPDGFKDQKFPSLDDDMRTLLARLYKAKAVKAATDSLVASFRALVAASLPAKAPSVDDPPREADQGVTPAALRQSKDEDEPQHVDRRAISISPSPSPESSFDGLSDDEDAAPRARSKASTFLPSLSAVGYVSGSDSDASSVTSEVAPRRNRRGQRARRAIAEKKHGARAKHLLQAANRNNGGGVNSRGSGWDPRRGAVDVAARDEKQPLVNAERAKMMAGRPFVKPGAAAAQARPPVEKRAKLPVQSARNRDDKGPIHPSWAAKKQQKAAEKNSTRKFEGQRIVFD